MVFLAAVLALLGFIVHNTLANLESRGISTGFGFLGNEAGFGIIQTLVDYSETSSFGRTFLVGLLNTLLVSVLGILLATLLGFVVGVARLSATGWSRNWPPTYIEIFRNIPLLLQIFFWYFAVLRALPRPRESLALGEAVFLNLRGLYLPRPLFEPGFGWVLAALALAVAAALLLGAWGAPSTPRTGRPSEWLDRARADPAVAAADLPARRRAARLGTAGAEGLQLPRRHHRDPGARRPVAGLDHLHRGLYRRDRARRHPGRARTARPRPPRRWA